MKEGEDTMAANEKTVELSASNICPRFEYTFNILGKKWNGLIIETLLNGPKRFKDITVSIDGVSDRVLAERLKELEAENLIKRPEGQENNPRGGYCLTKKGQDLRSIMDTVHDWSDKWIDIEDK